MTRRRLLACVALMLLAGAVAGAVAIAVRLDLPGLRGKRMRIQDEGASPRRQFPACGFGKPLVMGVVELVQQGPSLGGGERSAQGAAVSAVQVDGTSSDPGHGFIRIVRKPLRVCNEPRNRVPDGHAARLREELVRQPIGRAQNLCLEVFRGAHELGQNLRRDLD